MRSSGATRRPRWRRCWRISNAPTTSSSRSRDSPAGATRAFRPAAPGRSDGCPPRRPIVSRELDEQMIKYLTDAHSIEVQALAQLRSAPDIAGAPELAEAFRVHLVETEEHERATRELLEARDASPSRVKDVVMAVGGKGFLLFARLQPDTPGKLFAHALSFEGLELASYELLRGVAERAGEQEVVDGAGRIRDDER